MTPTGSLHLDDEVRVSLLRGLVELRMCTCKVVQAAEGVDGAGGGGCRVQGQGAFYKSWALRARRVWSTCWKSPISAKDDVHIQPEHTPLS